MAQSLNKVMLIGRLGRDPELKYTEKGDAFCNFGLATSETYTGADGKDVERTEWHNISVWRKLAEICSQYLKKGSLIYMEGRIRTSVDAKDDTKRYHNIDMTSMVMLDSKKSSENKEGNKNVVDEENVPF